MVGLVCSIEILAEAEPTRQPSGSPVARRERCPSSDTSRLQDQQPMMECQWVNRWADPAWLSDKEGRTMSGVNLGTHELNGYPVVTVRGQLDVAGARCVAAHLTTAAAVYGPWIIADLEGLDFIDCSGLGMLVGVLRRVRASGGNLLLAAPQRMVRKVLTVTGLIDVFSVHPTVEHATCGQGPGRARSLAGNLVTIRGLQTANMPTTTAIA